MRCRAALAARHQQGDARQAEGNVRQPHRHDRLQLAQPGGFLSLGDQHVVKDDDADREREARRLSAAPVVVGERQGEQAEHQRGGRDGEHLLDFDLGDVALLDGSSRIGGHRSQLSERHGADFLLDSRSLTLRTAGAIEQHQAQLLVAARFVAVRAGELEGVLDGIFEAQVDPLAPFDEIEPTASGHDHLVRRVAAGDGGGEEDALPVAAARRRSEDVEDLPLELAVEDPGFELRAQSPGRGLRGELYEGLVGARLDLDHQVAVDQGDGQRQASDDRNQAVDAHAAGAQRDQLAVRGEATDS